MLDSLKCVLVVKRALLSTSTQILEAQYLRYVYQRLTSMLSNRIAGFLKKI